MSTSNIYRVVVEGGKSPVDESFFLFFKGVDRVDASRSLDQLIKTLFGELHEHYEAHGLQSGDELYRQSIDPYAFKDAYLFECGTRGGNPVYIKDAMIFMVGYDRVRLEEAFALGRAKQTIHHES